MGSFRNGARAAAFQCILGLITCFIGAGAAVAAVVHPLEIQALDSTVSDATISEVTRGTLDSHFTSTSFKEPASRGEVFWVRIHGPATSGNSAIPVLVVHSGIFHNLRVYAAGTGSAQPLPQAARMPAFAGARDTAFILPADRGTVYVRIAPPGTGYGVPRFAISTLDAFLSEGANRARMITLAFGALAAMAFASLLIWIVLADRAFILYFSLFTLQALYVAYFSGQGFEWPWLSAAAPLWAATMAGGTIDALRGSQDTLTAPTVEGRATSLGVLFSLLAATIFLGMGGPAHVLEALGSSPPGIGDGITRAAGDIAAGIGIAVAIAAPLIAASIIIELAGALIARAASPAHLHAFLAPIRSLALLILTALLLNRIAAFMAVVIR